MTPMLDTPRFTTMLLVLSLATSGAGAQPVRRVPVHPDTLARLMAGLSSATTAAANAYISGSYASASAALPALRADPAALGFVLAVLTKEPSRDLRRSLIAIVQVSENRARLDVRVPLQQVVREDPDSLVLRSASDALRAIALRETQPRWLLVSRIT